MQRSIGRFSKLIMKSGATKPADGFRRRHFPVLDRMILMEFLSSLAAVLGVLVAIIVSRKFLAILGKAIEGEVAAETVFQLLGYKILSVSILLLPPALFLAALMVFGRMYRDQEMSVLAAVGVGPGRLYRAGAYFVLPLAAISAVLALQVMPWADARAQQLLKKDEKTADLRGIKPGKFNEFSRGDVVFYAESMAESDRRLKNIFVQSRDGREIAVVLSQQGYLKQTDQGENFIVLEHGARYQGTPGQSDFIVTEFDEYGVRIEDSAGESGRIRRESLPTETLWDSPIPREKAELMRRTAIPLGVLVLGILSLPLARMTPRSGVYGNVVTAFLLFVIYENLQKLSQAMVISERIPTWLGYGASYVLMLTLAMALLRFSIGGGIGLGGWSGRIRQP